MRDNLPFVLEDDSSKNADWISANAGNITENVDRFGAVLIHGFDSWSEGSIRGAVQAISGSDPLPYVYRSTPRTELGRGVYTATEYPAGLSIPLHNENAYQRDWPMLLFFFCQQPAEKGGGQTTLADTLAVTQRIDQAIRKKFAERRVMYIRNYRNDIDLPWTVVFQTTSRKDVEEYCMAHDMMFEWTGEDNLRTRQVCDALQAHPRNGEQIWFNQAHLFHPSSLDQRTREMMAQMFADEDLPRNAKYGDGAKLDEIDLQAIRDAFDGETVGVSWRKGDFLVLDNMRISHGRSPYRGTRRVFTAMARPFSSIERLSALGDTKHAM